jgi:hypothetical protein
MAVDQSVTFYTVSDRRFFPGLVGLLNSLRKMGHDKPLVVGDCGLTTIQRKLLAPHCTLFDLSGILVKNPQYCKPFPFSLKPHGTVVFIDSDMIVTRNLNALLAAAGEGKICAFPDPEHDRWFAEWRELFDLPAAPRRQTYVCTGFVAFSTTKWPNLLERWWEAIGRISSLPSYQEGAEGSAPYAQPDQDALNALLMSEFPSDALSFLPEEEQVFSWQFNRVDSVDDDALACQYMGAQPSILHAASTPKPWMRGGVRRRSVYLRFLRRLLTAPDVALSVPPHLLEIWLRRGVASELACYGLSFANRLSFANMCRSLLPERVRPPLRRLRAWFLGNAKSMIGPRNSI